MSEFNIMDPKTAAAMGQAMNKIKNNRKIHIKPCEWEKTDKKPQIVDLWCMFKKAQDNHYDTPPKFDFEEAADRGITFYGWGLLEAGEILAIKSALDELKVEYHEDNGD